MNKFTELLSRHSKDTTARGLVYTPNEIAQQPSSWLKVADIIAEAPGLKEFLNESGVTGNNECTVILTGAGSSEFVGNSVQNLLREKLHREVISIPTTHLVTHAANILVPEHTYTLVSFARSGDSPESVATYDIVKKISPQTRHIVITCNQSGALAERASSDSNSFLLLMPEETNDRSLVMTSSFTSMFLAAAGLGYVDSIDEFREIVTKLGRGAERIIRSYGDEIEGFATQKFARACFLGSNTLYGAMQECQLKLQEMTEGRVASRFESFLGLRHGPKVFVTNKCVVIAAVSSDPDVRRYEADMLREIRQEKLGMGTLVICASKTPDIADLADQFIELYPEEDPVPDNFRVATDVCVGQIFALFRCMSFGLRPDNPSTSGSISRVVKGVTIYD